MSKRLETLSSASRQLFLKFNHKLLRLHIFMTLLVVMSRVHMCHSWQACSSQSAQLFSSRCCDPLRKRGDVPTGKNHMRRSCPSELRRSHFHSTVSCRLNRFLFDPCEVVKDELSSVPTVTLSKQDYRTIHAAKILNVKNGDTVRAGLVATDGSDGSKGLLTDEAVIEWISVGGATKQKKPLKPGEIPGSLRFRLESLTKLPEKQREMNVSLILALPRPLQLGRLLPMISQLGVDHLVLTSARKVPRDYFGSHLLREPAELRERLIEGLCQAGDVRLPKVHIVRNLRSFLDNDLDELFPDSDYARVIAHPQRATDGSDPFRIRDVKFPADNKPPCMVVAVGPEGGWLEPNELQHFSRHDFQQVTLGTRVLRSDVAVISLLTLAHDACIAKAQSLQTSSGIDSVEL